MEPDKRYFDGKGLYRLVRDGLESLEDSERVEAAVKSGKHGKSTASYRTWQCDEDENETPIPGTFAVYQRIMHDRDVRSSEEEETRSQRSHKEQCEFKAQSRRLDNLNTKLNLTIAALIGVAMTGFAGYLHYIVQLTGQECCIVMLLAGLCIMAGLWLNCECRELCRL